MAPPNRPAVTELMHVALACCRCLGVITPLLAIVVVDGPGLGAVDAPGGDLVPAVWKPAPSDLDLDQPPGSQVTTLAIGGQSILIVAGPGLPVPRAAIHRWIQRAATAITGFFGRFPVSGASVIVVADGDEGVHEGVTYGGRKIMVELGTASTPTELDHDWVMTHEMFHLTIPDLSVRYRWVEEGAACYFEPIARARAGQLTPARLWKELMDGAPQGEPERGDQGLDNTHTWGRIYWGGTLFWLLADCDIRRRTGNAHSVDDVLRGVIAGGADGASHWDLPMLWATGDHITGVDTMTALHVRQGEHAETIDLPGLWRRLGVSIVKDDVVFNEGAEWAGLRRAMTAQNAPGTVPAAR